MATFQECMLEYRKQLQQGSIQQAYKGLMDYLVHLRGDLVEKHPQWVAPGGIYFGYLDMTYFSITPPALKERNLKIAIVFLHREFRFEVWLAAANRQLQAKYWQLFRDSSWQKYDLVAPATGVDAIVSHILVSDPDFSNLGNLTGRIDGETTRFIRDVEDFFSRQ
jgi:hypothetical protein